ncbi:unnamed protein product [Moneuplotes crassus]|uniref:Uncharacterized protein n=1 Tax=Euplotes crassus TaxID=5936 RepID=A0AAD1XRQ0_EUPCR|nr:unnamed protein product [Moneuplotes crassus]
MFQSSLPKYLFRRVFSTQQRVANVSGSTIAFKPFEPQAISSPPKCYYPDFVEPEPEPVVMRDKMVNLPYSSQRLNDCCKEIRGMHISEAFTTISKNKKKGASYLYDLLTRMRDDGKEKGLNPDFFYVEEAYVGKGIRGKKLDIKARGKFGVIRRPKSSLNIILHEKPLEHIIREALKGQTPQGIGEIFRRRLYETNADFEELRKYSFMLTAKGRYYRRQQFRRLVHMAQQEYQKKGIHIKAALIEKFLLDKQILEITQDRRDIKMNDDREQILARKKHFEENYKKKK